MKIKSRKFQYLCIVIGTAISLNANVRYQRVQSRGPQGPYDDVGDPVKRDVSPANPRQRRSVRPQWEDV